MLGVVCPISGSGTEMGGMSMPVYERRDRQGPYFQWGDHGKQYRYTEGDEKSKAQAKQQAAKQGRAAYARGYKG